MSTHDYRVQGMTCDHCAMAVREEVARVAGVRDVEVDLATRRLTVTGEGVDDVAVSSAVQDAGYTVVS